MKKQMPGFDKYQADLEKKQKLEKEQEEAKQRKAREEQEKRQSAAREKQAQSLLNAKLNIISKNDKNLAQKSKVASFMKGFFISNMISFIIGSMAYLSNDGRNPEDYPFGHEPLFAHNEIYGDMSYKQAIKNAYLLDDMLHGKGGVFQGICGLISILMSVFIGVYSAGLAAEDNKKKVAEAKKLLTKLEQVKDYGVDIRELLKDLTPSITKILESLSEIDRGYFDNLVAGGLDEANYDTCVAIVSGYLKSHPKEYNKVIEIIDEATLPEAVKKKYGKGKTISFAAAQELQKER